MKKNIQKLFTEKIFCVEKKRLLFLVTLLMSTMIWAQVGINTDTPNANSDLELGSNNKALLLNRVANTAAVASPVNGMLIYDNSVNCVKAYENNAWSTCLSSGSTSTSPSTGGTGVVSSYGAPACTAGSVSGTMTEGVAVSGVTMTVYANVTTLGTYSITSGPVNGVTFSGSGTFTATGCQAITLTATGTPTAAGTYNYPLSTTPSETVSATVASGAGAGTIASIDCAGATTTGTLTSGTAASGVSSSVPYTGGNGGSYAAQTVTSTGVTGLTANLAAGSFATGAGDLTYTITGTPASSGMAAFALSIGGQSCTLNIEVTKIDCTVPTSSGGTLTFLCHNLGADQTADPFTPSWRLNGAYIQWGKRGPTTSWQTTASNGPLGFGAAPTDGTAAGSNYTTIASWSNKTDNAADGAWNITESSPVKTAADPCPTGYRVPTRTEWLSIHNTSPINTTTNWSNVGGASWGSPGSTSYSTGKMVKNGTNNSLYLPAAGRIDHFGSPSIRGISGFYWSSTPQFLPNVDSISYGLYFTSTSIVPEATGYREHGYSVRCIKQ